MRRKCAVSVLAAVLVGVCACVASAAVPGSGPDEAAGVNNRRGDASPAGGFSTNETNSRIDDYIYQDEQINLTESSGVVKVLRVNQKNLINDYVVATFPLKNEKAMDMAREVRDTFRVVTGKEGGRAEVIRDKVTNQVFLQVICPKFQLPWIEKALAALDVPWIKENSDGFDKVYYKAKYRKIDDMLPIANSWADGEGQTRVDTANNGAMRREEPYRAKSWLKALGEIDIPPNQIMFEGAIYEINGENTLKLGLDYIAWKNGPGRNLFDIVSGGRETSESWNSRSSIWSPVQQRATEPPDTLDTSMAQNYSYVNVLVTAAYVDFLAAKGKARVVARPKLVARSNQAATFTATEQILGFNVQPDVVTRTAVITGTDIGVDRTVNYGLVGTSEATTTGVTMTVLPNIGTQSSEVQVTLSFRTLGGLTPQGTPIINRRDMTTRVRVVDGQPLILGGVSRGEEVSKFAGVPYLSSIPVIGLLFGGEEHSNRCVEYVVVLTPKMIIGAQADLATVKDVEIRDMVTGKKRIALPDAPWGFDQWLLDLKS